MLVRDCPASGFMFTHWAIRRVRSSNQQNNLLTTWLEIFSRWEVWHFDHGAGAETCAQVWGASQNPAEMVVVHEVIALVLQTLLDGRCCFGKALDNTLDVVTLFHWDDSHLIFLEIDFWPISNWKIESYLVNPNKKILIVVMEDSTGIRPVTTASLEKVKFKSY